LFARPLAVDQVRDLVRGWLDAPTASVVHPGERHLDLMMKLLSDAGTAGNMTTDAHLAALALETGGTIVTFDADFDRFPGVRWTRPE
jgi:predicted nucleic acid-binding protein